MTDDAREELIDALLDQLSAGRDGLPEELRERLLDGMIDELIAGKRGEREILGRTACSARSPAGWSSERWRRS